MAGRLTRHLGPLQEPSFRRLWIGQTASAAGDGMTGVALTFAVLGLGRSAADLGLVLASFMVPRVIFMLVGGVWADRLPRRSTSKRSFHAVHMISATSPAWPKTCQRKAP